MATPVLESLIEIDETGRARIAGERMRGSEFEPTLSQVELVARVYEPEDIASKLEFIPIPGL